MIHPSSLAEAPRSSFQGVAYRHLAPDYDPRSGRGARMHGGRFNPPASFPVLYLCTTRPCAAAELRRFGKRVPVGVEGLLPRKLYEYALSLDGILDLSVASTREAVELTPAELTAADWGTCQQLGAAAHDLGFSAIRSPSATGVDDVLALFLENIGTERLEVRLVATWSDVSDLM